jgi:hypothetical protein
MSEVLLDVTGPKPGTPDQVRILTGPRDITQKELADYAKATGVKLVKLKAIKKRAILGELIDRLGTPQQGMAIIIDGPEKITSAVEQIDGLIDDYRHDPKAVAQLIKAKASLIAELMKVGQTLITSKKDSTVAPDVTPQRQPFPAGSPVTLAVQVNNVAKENSDQ